MLPGNTDNTNNQQQVKENTQSNSNPPAARDEHVSEALQQAEHDIAMDPEFSAHSPNDDLDEGETALLGNDVTDIV